MTLFQKFRAPPILTLAKTLTLALALTAAPAMAMEGSNAFSYTSCGGTSGAEMPSVNQAPPYGESVQALINHFSKMEIAEKVQHFGQNLHGDATNFMANELGCDESMCLEERMIPQQNRESWDQFNRK